MTTKMPSTASFLDPHVLANLQGLTLRARHVIDGFMSGTHRGNSSGTSTEYSQHRGYVPGDDLRHVDWKAFARTDRMVVKQFLDETNLAVTCLLDTSRSMRYRGQDTPLSKWDYGACLCGTLAWLVQSQGDAIGIFLARADHHCRLPPAASQENLAEILRLLETHPADGDSQFGQDIHDWALNSDHRQSVVVVSDLFGDEAMLCQALQELRRFGHDVIVFQLNDPDEVEFPFDRFMEFRGMESAESITLDAEVGREEYLRQRAAFLSRFGLFCRRWDIDFLPLTSDQSLGVALARFLLNRNRPDSSVPGL